MGVHINDGDPGPFPSKALRDTKPETLCRTGDDGHLTFESWHLSSSVSGPGQLYICRRRHRTLRDCNGSISALVAPWTIARHCRESERFESWRAFAQYQIIG